MIEKMEKGEVKEIVKEKDKVKMRKKIEKRNKGEF